MITAGPRPEQSGAAFLLAGSVYHLRKEYTKATLDPEKTPEDPFGLFGEWFKQAEAAKLAEPNAMALATVDARGYPSQRMVLLKGWDDLGFRFFCHYESRKGRNIAENPHAALLFFWGDLERQIRIEGEVQKLSSEESLCYFHSRPRGAQLSAYCSPQSRPIASREVLEKLWQETNQQYPDTVPLPNAWGGFILKPTYFEFWQGRENRLHDRVSYELTAPTIWTKKRLAP